MARKKQDFTQAEATYTDMIGTALAADDAEPKPKQDTTRRNAYKHFCIALTKTRHEFITTMAAMNGTTASKYLDRLIDEAMEQYADVYQDTIALQRRMRGSNNNE